MSRSDGLDATRYSGRVSRPAFNLDASAAEMYGVVSISKQMPRTLRPSARLAQAVSGHDERRTQCPE
jgi:hypothetical protein